MRPGKILISLCDCTGWSESSLGAHFEGTFPDVAAHNCHFCLIALKRLMVDNIKTTMLIHDKCPAFLLRKSGDIHLFAENIHTWKLREWPTYDYITEPAQVKIFNKTCDQRRLRSACASAQSDQSFRRSHAPSAASGLSVQRWTKTLAILSGCTGWSESLLVTQILL